MFKKKETPSSAIPEKISKRVSRLSPGVIGSYIETHVSDVGKYARLYEATGQDAYLDEAVTNAQVVLALVSEMKNRAG
jgi:hypothetical protein